MNQSITIARFAGIPVKLHWSIILLLCFVLGSIFRSSESLQHSFFFVSYFVLLFVCVLLHEFGHALVAKRYGISTRDIILSPIGGLARLEYIPKIPMQEFYIAIGGPLVNVVLVLICLIFVWIRAIPLNFDVEYLFLNPSFDSMIQFLFWMNLTLFAFNLIPAFPMDGGRILRSLLSVKWGFDTATRWATAVGKLLAVGIFFYAIIDQQYILTIITAFVFITANREYQNLQTKKLLETTSAEAIVYPSWTKIYLEDPLEKPLNIFSQGSEQSFLVFDENDVLVGSLPSLFLMQAKKEKQHHQAVHSIASSKGVSLNHNINLHDVFHQMNTQGLGVVAIVKNDEIIGTIDRKIFGEYVKEKTKFSWFHL